MLYLGPQLLFIILRYIYVSPEFGNLSVAVRQLFAVRLHLRLVLGRLLVELRHFVVESGDDVVFRLDSHVGVQTKTSRVAHDLVELNTGAMVTRTEQFQTLFFLVAQKIAVVQGRLHLDSAQ